MDDAGVRQMKTGDISKYRFSDSRLILNRRILIFIRVRCNLGGFNCMPPTGTVPQVVPLLILPYFVIAISDHK
jgi:hypothetical protein